jgi:allene oxide cyclase-like protein
MKRLVIPVVLVAGVVAVIAVNAAAKGKPVGPGPGGHTIHVIEHATSDAVTNGAAGDAAGNVLTFANPVYDRKDAQQVGSDQGYCVRIVVGQTWECNWTTFLPKGQITVEGPFSDTGNTVVAITGGTGKYRNVRGSMELKYHNPAGTEFDFVFHLIG